MASDAQNLNLPGPDGALSPMPAKAPDTAQPPPAPKSTDPVRFTLSADRRETYARVFDGASHFVTGKGDRMGYQNRIFERLLIGLDALITAAPESFAMLCGNIGSAQPKNTPGAAQDREDFARFMAWRKGLGGNQ